MEALRNLGVPPSIIDEVEQAGRNSNIRVKLVPNDGSLRIVFKDEEHMHADAAGIAPKHLMSVLLSIGHKFQHLDVIKISNEIAIDSQFCQTIQSGLQNLKVLEISFLHFWSAGEVETLLKHVPSGISKLKLYDPGPECSALFQQIPMSLPKLQALDLQGEDIDAIGSQCLEEWAVSIGMQTSLETLAFCGFSSKEEDWNSVLLAIQAHPSLMTVHFEHLYTPDGLAIKFDKKMEDSILCCLAINRAKAKLKLADVNNHGPALKNWVNAVVASRHQVGCLDYLLSSVDPTIYAPAAIKGVQGLTYKRKLERAFFSEDGAEERLQELKRQRELGEQEWEEERAKVFR